MEMLLLRIDTCLIFSRFDNEKSTREMEMHLFLGILGTMLFMCKNQDIDGPQATSSTRQRRSSPTQMIKAWIKIWSSDNLEEPCLDELTLSGGGIVDIFATKRHNNISGFWSDNLGNKRNWECEWTNWGKWTIGLTGEGIRLSVSFQNPIMSMNQQGYSITKVITENMTKEGVKWEVVGSNRGGEVKVSLTIDEGREPTTVASPMTYSTTLAPPRVDNYVDNPMCEGKKILSSGPFQISAMNPTPILRDATFQLISWKIRLTDWLVSRHFQNCSTITATMERSLIRWVMGTKRNKRDIVDTVLGGVGTGLGVVNTIDISSLTTTLQSEGLLNSKGLHAQQTINTLVEGLTNAVIDIQGPAIQHIQEILVGVIGRSREVSWNFVCLSMQTELSTDFKILAQAMDNNHTPLGGWQQAEINRFALDHKELWVNSWLGCKGNICRANSLVPTRGTYQNIYHMTSLGTPVTESHVLHHELEFPNFIVNGTTIEQVDVEGCMRFPNKILCLPNQVRTVFDSCWHNHSYCQGFVEKVKPQDMIFPLGHGKVCFVSLKPRDEVHIWFKHCISREQITQGIYCVIDYPVRISSQQFNLTVPQVLTYNKTLGSPLIVPIVSDSTPWQKWVRQLKDDQILLKHLQHFGERVHVNFHHQQQELQRIEHTFSDLSSATWWQKLVNSFSKHSSWGSALGNVMLHPFIVVLIVSILCIIVQICMCCYLKSMIARIYHLYYGIHMKTALVK
ncbi:uncharacterized protein O3C94_004727 [Discoglossus pictus]